MEQTTYTMPQIREAFLTMFDDLPQPEINEFAGPAEEQNFSTNQVWHLFQNKLKSISTT